MATNIIAFPTAPKTAFTDAERNALIACAYSLPGDVEAEFDTDEEGVQACWFMPGDGWYSVEFIGIQGGAMTRNGDVGCPILTTRDIRVIVAAIADDWA